MLNLFDGQCAKAPDAPCGKSGGGNRSRSPLSLKPATGCPPRPSVAGVQKVKFLGYSFHFEDFLLMFFGALDKVPLVLTEFADGGNYEIS